MKYSVILSPQAEKELTAFWLTTTAAADLTAAADAIDRQLSHHPHDFGDVLFDTVRRACIWPLWVDFEVIEADIRVIVLQFHIADELG